jgi:hypothetical protein
MEASAAAQAIQGLDNTEFQGRTIRVNEAAPQGDRGGGESSGGARGAVGACMNECMHAQQTKSPCPRGPPACPALADPDLPLFHLVRAPKAAAVAAVASAAAVVAAAAAVVATVAAAGTVAAAVATAAGGTKWTYLF